MSNRRLKHIAGKPVYVHHDVTSIEQLVKIFPQWDGTYDQLTCGNMRGTVQLARGHFIMAHAAQSNQSILIRGIEKPQLCNFTLVTDSASTCFWQRRQLKSQSLLVRNIDVNHQTMRKSTNLSLAVSPENFRQAFRAVNQADFRHVNWHSFELPPDVFQELLTLHQQFLILVSDASNEVEVYLLEQAIMRVLAEVLNPARTTKEKAMPLSSRSKLVNRAEDLMRSSLNEPLGEIDLCTILGVSGRTLRTAFRERFGLGPIVYHQTLRLNAVRSRLMTGAATANGVASIAKDYGFNHPGKFAGYYRRQFGEVPSLAKIRYA